MGSIGKFTKEKLVIGVLSTRPGRHGELEEILTDAFGPIEQVYGPGPFTFTDYYEKEMGPGIQRYFYVARDLVSPEGLASIKHQTDRIEQRFSEEGKRKINLDPGILSRDRFILATTKDRGHRIPLQQGVYGEVTLIYMHGGYQVLPWTYTDFRTEAYRDLLKEIRNSYLWQIRSETVK